MIESIYLFAGMIAWAGLFAAIKNFRGHSQGWTSDAVKKI